MLQCLLCKSTKDDPVKYGPYLEKDGIMAHMNCVYLTSTLVQTKDEHEGILGFETNKIREEAQKMKKYICCYCKKDNANIGCCQTRCHRRFHTTCGVENNVQYQFCKTFISLCDKHARKVKYRPQRDETCCICYDNLLNKGEIFNAMRVLRAPCCQNGWFHKYCLQKYANVSGYFFKCPLCNAFEQFRKELPYWGIFIPDRDAEWELENNAFVELTHRPQRCIAVQCVNVRGREQYSDDNPYVYCNTCGAVAIHEKCKKEGTFHCNDCLEILKTSHENDIPNRNEDAVVDIESFTDDDNDNSNKYNDGCNLTRQRNENVNNEEWKTMSSETTNNSPDSGNYSECLKINNLDSEDSLIDTKWYWSKRKKRAVNRICSASSDDSQDKGVSFKRRKSRRLKETSISCSSSNSSSSTTAANSLRLNKPEIEKDLKIFINHDGSDSDDPLCDDTLFKRHSVKNIERQRNYLEHKAKKIEKYSEPVDHYKRSKKPKIMVEEERKLSDENRMTKLKEKMVLDESPTSLRVATSCIANRTRRKSQSTDNSGGSSPPLLYRRRSRRRRHTVLSTTDED